MQKKDFIDTALKSLEGIQSAQASDFMYTRVMAGVEKRNNHHSSLLKPKFAVFALCALSLLVVLNVIFLLGEASLKEKKVNIASQVQTEYFSYTNYNY